MLPRSICWSICLGLASVWVAGAIASAQDLPAESVLPSEQRRITDQLPSESMLPVANAVETNQPSDLPSEADLPPAVRVADVADSTRLDGMDGDFPQVIIESDSAADVQELSDDLKSAADRPWLRLMLDGPAAPLRTIEFSADSRHLLAGGDDKSLHVWSRIDEADLAEPGWSYQRAIHWQVQRGPRGAIRAVAAQNDRIFFAGVGASPLTSEVAMVDAKTLRLQRCLFDYESGSWGEVASLSAVADAGFIALDVSGRIAYWQADRATGLWSPQLIRSGDADMLDPDLASSAARFRRLGSALAASSNGYVAFADVVPTDDRNVPQWQIIRRNLSTGLEEKLAAPIHLPGSVPAIAISSDGDRIVAADLTDAGRFFVWTLSRGPDAKAYQSDAPIRTLRFSPSGNWLLVGTANNANGNSSVSLLAIQPDGTVRPTKSWQHDQHVMASAFSPDDQWIAYTLGSKVLVRRVDNLDRESITLTSHGLQPRRAVFSADEAGGYRVRLQSTETAAPDDLVFDPQHPGLAAAADQPEIRWTVTNPFPDRWQLRQTVDRQTGNAQWQVVIGGEALCRLPLDSNADGSVTSTCWLIDPNTPERPVGLAVGTNKRCHLYVYRITADEWAPLVRQYRGHESAIRSVCASFDQKYLLTYSDDATVRFWKLDNALVDKFDQATNAWGATFRVDGDRLIADEVVEDGPLYFRGVRSGDVIDAMAWRTLGAAEETRVTDAKTIKIELESERPGLMIRFETRRRSAVLPAFNLNPAWQPLASLVVTTEREWAFWSPYGYYDASFNGHKVFGWQVNQGVQLPPEFFRAAEMKSELEKPELMDKLLTQGSMHGSFQALRQTTPANLHERLAAENRLRPRVQIVQPIDGDSHTGNSVIVEAIVEQPIGTSLVQPKAFANGVPAGPAQWMSTVWSGDTARHTYAWRQALPSDRRIRIQVVAANRLGSSDVASIDIDHSVDAPPPRPRLFLIAAAVNSYTDSQIPRLEFAINNVTEVKELLSDANRSLFDTDATLLLESSANRWLFSVAADRALQELRQTARPDDLLMIYLSGHGLSDVVADQYFFVTPTARHVDLVGRQFGDCISLEDFAKFSNIPCRKLVVLDTCESGTFAATGQQDLKPLVRALEGDLFLTLTAAAGTDEAYESTSDQLSYFAASFVEGIRGAADQRAMGGNANGVVDFSEIVRFVARRVPAEIAEIGKRQYPAAAPKELLDVVEIPLTKVSDASR